MNVYYTILCLLHAATAYQSVIRNNVPRRDVDNNLLHVGDGNLVRFGDTFYLYGTRYDDCPVSLQKRCYYWCGWRNMTFTLYMSKDLEQWDLVSTDVLPQMRTHPTINSNHTAFFEPSVVYNPVTKLYVMWFVMQVSGNFGGQGVATSTSPHGPFTYAREDLPIPENKPSSDVFLWIDEDTGTAYMKHNVNADTHTVPTGKPPSHVPMNLVSRLSSDFLRVVETSKPVGEPGSYYESGSLFKRNGLWYVTYGKGCCFCPYGGDLLVFTSHEPLGPYEYQGNINPRPSHHMDHGAFQVGVFHDQKPGSQVNFQQFGIAAIGDQNSSIWVTGMRFGSAPDGYKSHDSQYWAPLIFEADNTTIAPLRNVSSFVVDL